MPASPPAMRLLPFMPKIVGPAMMPPSLYQSILMCGTLGGLKDSLPEMLKCGSLMWGSSSFKPEKKPLIASMAAFTFSLALSMGVVIAVLMAFHTLVAVSLMPLNISETVVFTAVKTVLIFVLIPSAIFETVVFIPDILKLVDEGRIALTPAVELSYLNSHEQNTLYQIMDCDELTPSLSQAQRLRKLSEDYTLTDSGISQIMSEIKGNQKEYLKIEAAPLRRYFPPGTTAKQMQTTMIRAIEFYRQHTQNRADKQKEREER